MDIALERPKSRRRPLLFGGGAVVLLGLVVGLSRLKPAAPEVDRQSLLVDSVKEAPLVLEVRGTGTLVPVDVRILTAPVACKVERIHLYPGTAVKEGSLIAEFSSPEATQAAEEARWNLRKAEADFRLNQLTQKAALTSAKAGAAEAEAGLKAAERLFREGLVAETEVLRARARHEEAAGRLATEAARLDLIEGKGGIAPARAVLEQARAQAALRQSQVAALSLRPGMSGILQLLPLQVGQQLAPGTVLAKVAKPLPLKAELRVSEVQAKDVQVGQVARVDTRNGVVEGRVQRVDPAVQNGTVLVDVGLPAELPKGVRPDLSVDGVVELDRVGKALQVGRPVQAQGGGALSLFKLSPDGSEAVRVKVRLGRASVNTVEILEGLQPGDRVVLSDTSAWDAHDRIRLR